MQKKLRQALQLQDEHAAGKELNEDQQQKVLSIPSLQQQLRRLQAEGDDAGGAPSSAAAEVEVGLFELDLSANEVPPQPPAAAPLMAAPPPSAAPVAAAAPSANGPSAAAPSSSSMLVSEKPIIAAGSLFGHGGGGGGGSARPSAHTRASSRASWEDADLALPDESLYETATISGAPISAAAAKGSGSSAVVLPPALLQPTPEQPPTDGNRASGKSDEAEEEEQRLQVSTGNNSSGVANGLSSAGLPTSPNREAWGGPSPWGKNNSGWRSKDGARKPGGGQIGNLGGSGGMLLGSDGQPVASAATQQKSGEVILDKNPALRTVVNKVGVLANEFRTFSMEVLAGENSTETAVKENGLKLFLDYSKVYWNSRLSGERERVLQLFCLISNGQRKISQFR